MTDDLARTIAKVPAITLGFWIIKILATTLGETGGDTVSMTWLGEATPDAGASGLNGYLIGTAIFGTLLLGLLWLQVRARTFSRWRYWATIVASTTVGTTLADFATRSLGIGYLGGSLLLFACVIASLVSWHSATGSVDISRIIDARSECFYWATITFSQTLGTALGDWVADSSFGYSGAAMIFGAALAITATLSFWTGVSRVLLFWSAFILTRPLGATVGDFLDKPVSKGGLEFSRAVATVVLLSAILILIAILPQRPVERAH